MNVEEDVPHVLAVRHGTLRTTRDHVFHESTAPDGSPITLDYHAWIARVAGRTVLIDLGFSAAEAERRGRLPTLSLSSVHRRLGIADDFDGDVILTHLHYDHTGRVAELPRARFHVAAAELEHWLDRGADDGLLSADDLEALRLARRQGRVIAHEGEFSLSPAVRALPAPGHTPGQLMVRIAMEGAPGILITSDAAHLDEEYEHDLPFHAMTDVEAARRSYALIRARRATGDVILTGHQAGTVERYAPSTGPHVARIDLPESRRRTM
jgi:glyoxylase-like metal-dependent hydrolase (beta-lactamase superfamily II)